MSKTFIPVAVCVSTLFSVGAVIAAPTVYNDAMVVGQAAYEATVTAVGGTPTTVNLVQNQNTYNFSIGGVAGNVTISRPDGRAVSWQSGYSDNGVALSGAVISIDPDTAAGDPIPGYNSGVKFTFSTPINALGFQVGDWATCCQSNNRPADIVTQYGVPATGTGLWIAFDGGTARLVANSTDPNAGDHPGVVKTNSYTNFIASIDDRGTFNSVTFFGDGFGEYLVIGGLLDFAVVPLGSVSNDQVPMRTLGVQAPSTINFDAALDAVALRVSGLMPGSLEVQAPNTFQLAAAGDLSGLMDGTVPSRSFWFRALGHDARQGAVDGFAGFHSQAGGLAAGVDLDLGNKWVVGAAFSAADGKADFGDDRVGDNVKVNSVQLSTYATRNFGNWYGYGILAYAEHDFTTSRDSHATGIASGEFRGEQYGGRIGAGRPIQLAKVTITPMIGLEYSSLKLNGYTETGAGTNNLIVQGQTIERFQSQIGARLATAVLPGTGNYTLQPVFHAYWLHDFKTATPDVVAANAVAPGTTYSTASQGIASDTARLGATLLMKKGKTFTGELRYDLDLSESYSGQTLSAQARWLF